MFRFFRGEPKAEAELRRVLIFPSTTVNVFNEDIDVHPHWVARWVDDEGPIFGVGDTPMNALTHLESRMYAAKRAYRTGVEDGGA